MFELQKQPKISYVKTQDTLLHFTKILTKIFTLMVEEIRERSVTYFRIIQKIL